MLDSSYFVTIDYDPIKEESMLPFNLYLLNPSSDQVCPFLHANYEIDKDLKEYLEVLLKKGAQLAVMKSQLQTFYDFTGLDEELILSSTNDYVHELDTERENKINTILVQETKLTEEYGDFEIGKVIVDGSLTDDYSYLYKKARNEIIQFNLHYTHTVSLASYLAENLMQTDNFVNRVVSLSYFIAKGMGVINQRELSDIVVASFLHHIGNTHFPIDLNAKAQHDFAKEDIKEWELHPKYAAKFIEKLGLNISDRCLNIIKAHHQRENGMGFPEWEGDQKVDPFSEIVGVSSFLWEYAMGKIDGEKRSMKKAMQDFKQKKTETDIDKEYCKPLRKFIYSIDLDGTPEAVKDIPVDQDFDLKKTGTED